MKARLRPGTFVRSFYRAAWYGIVIEQTGNTVTVKRVLDRTGRPLRKMHTQPITISRRWLSVVPRPKGG